MKVRFLFLVLFFSVFFISCNRIIMKGVILSGKTGLEKMMKVENQLTGREIIMIGMIHLEKQEFFDEIRIYLDSLKNDGYMVFYEGIDMKKDVDSLRQDTLCRKFRRVAGFHLTDYTNKENKSLPRIFSSGDYEMQTLDILGLTTDRDTLVDLSLKEMIEQYEHDKSPIVLNEYDWDTDLMEKYKIRKAGGKNQYSRYHLIRTIREDHIIETVKATEYPKIVLLYGKAHWFMLYAPLRDMGFEIVEGKL